MTWYAAAASMAGTAHEKSGLPCQDYCASAIQGEFFFGAVSDGAGSASHAHDGSLYAVQKALALLQAQSWDHLPQKDDFWHFSATFHVGIRDELARRAMEQKLSLSDLACTLLAFVAGPKWLAAIHIGDCLLAAKPTHGDCELLFKPDRGEYVNETTFVTSPDSFERLQVVVWPYRPAFVCAASDGVERVAVRLKDWSPHAPFFNTLHEYMQSRPSPERGAKDVAEFLGRAKLRARTDDDTSLLLGAQFA